MDQYCAQKTNDPTKFEAYSEGLKLMEDSLIKRLWMVKTSLGEA